MNLLNPYRWESGQGPMGYFNHKINQFSINPSDQASLANRQASASVPTCPREAVSGHHSATIKAFLQNFLADF